MSYCIGNLIQWFLRVLLVYKLKVDRNIHYCSLYHSFAVGFARCMIPGMFLTGLHRYLIVYKQRGNVFSRRIIFVSCLSSYYPVYWQLLVYLFQSYVTPYYAKCYLFSFPYEFLILIAIPHSVLALLNLFFLIRLVKYLSQNINRLCVSLRKSEEDVKKGKMVIRAILIQGLLPFLSMFPAGFTLLVMSLMGYSDYANNSPLKRYRIPVVDYNFDEFLFVLFYLNPFLDACATFFVVKPYQEAFKQMMNGILCKQATPTPVLNLNAAVSPSHRHSTTRSWANQQNFGNSGSTRPTVLRSV